VPPRTQPEWATARRLPQMSLLRMGAFGLLTALCAYFPVSLAQMYKCQTPDGRTAFQDKPCAGEAKQGVVKQPDAASAGLAASQGDPEGAYRSFHQSIVGSFNPPQWFSYLPATKRTLFDRDTQASLRWVNAVQFMKDEMPRSYQITDRQPGAGGTLRLTATGMGKDFFGKPQQQSGVIDLVQEGGAWKISGLTWGKRTLP